MRLPFEERFWLRAPKSEGCWEWQGELYPSGYGRFWSGNHKSVRAHRQAWVYTNGPIPDGMLVCHTCDNRRCVNPAHLWLGTNAENIADMVAKGRCSRHGGPKKLTEAAVLEIRMLRAAGVSGRVAGGKFGVTKSTANRVARGADWPLASGPITRRVAP
jgi:hypothetical protein